MKIQSCFLLLTIFFIPVLLANTKVPVTCGSIIRLQNFNTQNYLHSHNLKYGTGSGQQSATGIRNTDDSGSLWIIKAKHGSQCKQGEVIKNGDIIRLEHLATQKNLHSHNHKSPLSNNQEVSAFGSNSDGNRDDDFEVITENVWFQDQKVSFKHTSTGLYLADSGKRYNRPIQGQTEICAINRNNKKLSHWKATYGIFFPSKVLRI
ncbi:stromal cell-derived factor 2-like protein [Anaeramoeba flamelloides]|uniref:Stromal cell-derived factor 2-like protein n=1 Tax=Anaeramoeba flamelloides TaxID=1746091 RepID=A0ABQ8Z3F1_9EUKA|nr:stromal cell-derived factor 2-like protein [Anaeramoeba flamelloides]